MKISEIINGESGSGQPQRRSSQPSSYIIGGRASAKMA